MSLIGAAILSASAYESAIASGIDSRRLYAPAHKAIWQAIEDSYNTEPEISLATVKNVLGDKVKDVGGMDYIVQCVERTESTHHMPSYVRIVNENWARRALVYHAQRLIDLKGDPCEAQGIAGSVSKVLDQLAASVGQQVSHTLPESFKPVEIDYLVYPYLPKGKAVLLDADGGTGKTGFAIALAAWLSNGRSLFGEYSGEPVRTLYLHKGEDGNDELETVFRANGGRPGYLRFAGEDLDLSSHGIGRLRQELKRHDIGFVVIDALLYFVPSHLNPEQVMKNSLVATEFLNPLMKMYADLGVVGLHLRHTTKGAKDKAASELGMGSQAFRNRHRGQLVARFHPDRHSHRGVVGITDEKGSLLVERGETFWFRREGLEIQRVDSITEDPFNGSAPTQVGRKRGDKQAECDEWVLKRLKGGPMTIASFLRDCRDAGFDRKQVYRARDFLGLSESYVGSQKCWSARDPFEYNTGDT